MNPEKFATLFSSVNRTWFPFMRPCRQHIESGTAVPCSCGFTDDSSFACSLKAEVERLGPDKCISYFEDEIFPVIVKDSSVDVKDDMGLWSIAWTNATPISTAAERDMISCPNLKALDSIVRVDIFGNVICIASSKNSAGDWHRLTTLMLCNGKRIW